MTSLYMILAYVYIILFFIILFIIVYTTFYSLEIEMFVNKDIIVLLGDSVLQNSLYVPKGKSVFEIISVSEPNSLCYATDDAHILDVYTQINRIPNNKNNSNFLFFLSVGGNDLFGLNRKEQINTLWNLYRSLIKHIILKFPNSRVVLLDLYYPLTIPNDLREIGMIWNKRLHNFAYQHNLRVITLSEILVQSEDFCYNIEPSEKGGTKIAQHILSYSNMW